MSGGGGGGECTVIGGHVYWHFGLKNTESKILFERQRSFSGGS